MVERAPRQFVLCTAALLLLGSGCAAPIASQPLSQAEAIRIADAEVRKQYHVPVDSFERSASHVASQNSWFIGYHPHFIGHRSRAQRDAAFVMQVDDKTRRAYRVYE
jgi:hypothetical protein